MNNANTISICEDDIEQKYTEFPADMDRFNVCCDLIATYNENNILFGNIVSCLNDIKNRLNAYVYEQSYDKLKIVINAFLSNLQPFLSAIKKHISKTAFENITHNAYDNHMEYQFCYELRNASQHKGFNLHVTIENHSNIKVFIDKKDLLEDIHLTAKTKVLLNKYLEQIELLNELNGFYNAQCEILKKAYLEVFNVDAHTRLLNFHIQNTDERFLYIGDYIRGEDDTGKETLKLNYLHFDRQKILSNIDFFKDAQKQFS